MISIRRLGLLMCSPASTITRSTIWPHCYPGIGESRCQAAPKRREPRGAREIDRLPRGRKIGGDFRLPEPDRRLPEAPFPAHHPTDAVQLSHRYPGKVARHQVSLHSTIPLRLPGESRRRVRRPLHPPRLDQPKPLRHPVAPSHRRMVPPAPRPYPRRSDRHAKVQRIAPSPLNTAGRLPRGTRRMDTTRLPCRCPATPAATSLPSTGLACRP